MKIAVNLLLGYAAKGVGVEIHTDILSIVEPRERTFLWKFSNTSEEDKVQICVGRLEDGIKSHQSLQVLLL